MKELISVTENAIVVAMNDQAYVAVTTDDEDDLSLVRLCVPLHTKNAATTDSLNEEKQKLDENMKNDNQIQAVAITRAKDVGRIYCAVSTSDKSLYVYSFTNDTLLDKETSEATPVLVHKTNKRCSALEFAKIASSGEIMGKFMDVIVAADLAGDVHAFPIEIDTKIGQNKRFLLGHTASMLTSLKIVHDKIFTADRDEKVRVSSFPHTFEVLGYLLGNESYVTDIDVKQDKYCATVSGDCTMRLWDYRTYQEILCIHLSREVNGETCRVLNNDGQGADEPPQNDVSCIPVRVTFNPEGNLIAVIFNKKNIVDIFAIEESEASGVKVEKKQSIPCCEKPLGIAFLHNDLVVLTKDPNYFMCFRSNVDGEFKSTDRERNCKLVDSIRCIGEKNGIEMPESILETDAATGKIKLERNLTEEREGFVEHKPWLEGKRVQRKREKEKRRKKRRFEELANQKDGNVDN
jgi:tRNA (guanine-N(7)-)-methyltransferase subunit TRM82